MFEVARNAIAQLINDAQDLGMQLETDNNGQLVLYTGVKETDNGEIAEMTDEDYNQE